MKRSPRDRKAASLSLSTFRQLNGYALAASAAGVGVLALTPVAEGKIVYTPANKTVGLNHAVPIDLNHDGIDDFDVFNLTHNSTTPFGDYLGGEPARSGNEIVVQKAGRGYSAAALAAGVRVGPGKQFRSGRDIMAYRSSGNGTISGGPWKNVKNRFLGLKFVIKGKTHYGWARLNVVIEDQNVNATITGYAYETVPDQPIITGKTEGGATLGTLARGR
jgi:hypothetical protein